MLKRWLLLFFLQTVIFRKKMTDETVANFANILLLNILNKIRFNKFVLTGKSKTADENECHP